MTISPPPEEQQKPDATRLNGAAKFGLALIIVSCTLYLLLLLVPFLTLSVASKAACVTAIIVGAEILFWIGVLFVGREAARRYRQWFSPRYCWHRLKDTCARLL